MSFRTDQKKTWAARLREQREALAPARTLPPALLAAAVAQPARFTPAIRTLLCVAAGGAAQAVLARLQELAPTHRAHVDAAGGSFVLASCRLAGDALALAAALHRGAGGESLRIAVVTGSCLVASPGAGAADFMVLAGEERGRAEALASQAAPGAVQVSRETLHAIDDAGSAEFVQVAHDEAGADAAHAAPASHWAGLLS